MGLGSLRAIAAFLAVAAAFAVPASAGKGDNTVTTQEPFEEVFDNPCTGELFVAKGYIHTRTYVDINPDGTTHFSGQSNLQGVEGYTLTGVRYIVQENASNHIIFDSDAAPFNVQGVFRLHFVRVTSDGTINKNDDFVLYIRMHTTINANGVPTATRLEDPQTRCN